jgi:hypothetical protein
MKNNKIKSIEKQAAEADIVFTEDIQYRWPKCEWCDSDEWCDREHPIAILHLDEDRQKVVGISDAGACYMHLRKPVSIEVAKAIVDGVTEP